MTEHYVNPVELRAAIRRGAFAGKTSGQCPGFVQANLVIVPQEYAAEFAEFCRRNPRPCPLLEELPAGEFRSRIAARAAAEAGRQQDRRRLVQIRSYVLDNSRIKDQRTNVETANTQKVLDGDLDAFIEPA